MTKEKKTGVIGMPGDKTLEDALLSGHAGVALMGRMGVSRFAYELTNFLNSEMQRGTHPVELLEALATFQVQVHASLAAQVMKTGGFGHTAELYGNVVRSEYVAHAMRSHAALGEIREAMHDRPH